MKTSNLLFLLFFLLPFCAKASPDTLAPALYILDGYTPEEMVMDLLADGNVQISNVQFQGAPVAVGYFDAGTVDFGVNAGIALSTGVVEQIPGVPADFISQNNAASGDGDLNDLINWVSNDAAVLTFDVIPSADSLMFYYIFGSEEYPEYVNSSFNDVFAFFIQGGPEYPEPFNMAKIPDTDIPVSINNLNEGAYAQYYVPFYTDIGGWIQLDTDGFIRFDAITTTLTCKAAVTPGATYSLKIAIGDVGDTSFDSGVFIGLESLGNDSLLVPPAEFQLQANQDTIFLENQSKYAVEYLWDFGDGNYSSEPNPVHVFDDLSGPQTVKLITENWCCKDSVDYTFNLPGSLLADFEVSDNVLCQGEAVQFTDLSSENITSWAWEFPGGTPQTSTEQHPLVTYDTPGTFDVRLTITNAIGTYSFSKTDFIAVQDASWTLTSNFYYYQDDEVIEFQNFDANVDQYFWDFGDGTTSTLPDPSHNYAAPGDYLVSLTVSNACYTEDFSAVITMYNYVNTSFLYNSEDCAPLDLDLWNISSNPSGVWNWTFPGGTPGTSTAASPEVTFSSPGTYEVTVIAGEAPFIQYDTLLVTVVPGIEPGFDYSVFQQTMSFTNTSQNATSYEWEFGDGNSAIEESPNHSYLAPGTYEVKLTALNAHCAEEMMQTVVMENLVEAAFTSSPANGCAPHEVAFEGTVLNSEIPLMTWWFQGGDPAFSTEANPVVSYETPGFYDVTLYGGFGNFKDTLYQIAYVEIEEYIEPVAAFEILPNGVAFDFVNTSQEATSYLWDFGDGNSSTEENPSHIFSSAGTFEVQLIAQNLCNADTVQVTVIVTGTRDLIDATSAFKVFPNPAGSFLNIQPLSPVAEPYDLALFNAQGQQVLAKIGCQAAYTLELEFSPKGVYYLQIKQAGQLFQQEVILRY